MNCPLCDQPMKKMHQDISYNANANNKEYYRVVYKCPADDVWVTAEIPKKVVE